MKIVFLGTSGSMPTQSRASSAIAIRRKGEVIIFDCGEGTQRRMVEAGIGFRRRTIIFISHLHGDHVLGLPGLLQTMTLLKRERILWIYGPKGLVDFVEAFRKVIGGPGFPVEIYEIISGGTIYRAEEYDVVAVAANHDVPAWSYVLHEKPRPGRFHPEKAKDLGVPVGPLWKRLQKGQDIKLISGRIVRSKEVVEPSRKGLKIAYSGDTRPNRELADAAKGANLMIHEATFDVSLLERAEENGHSTASQAAEIAKAAEVQRLVLTHISSRYPDPTPLLNEARKIFPETDIAEDLLEIELR